MVDPVAVEPASGARFGLLGPVQVVDGTGSAWSVPAAKQRIVLAALLLGTGRVVSAASLAEALWDASPPPNAPAVLRTYVMRLRRALGPVGARVIGRSPGWAVELHTPEEFDVAEVDGLWRAARAAAGAEEWRQASLLLSRALGLWRGEPLADVPSAALARREADRFAELRLQLTEARIDADLRLGKHSEVVSVLRRLAAEHPLREHIRAQLMLACYRCGQQAAALEVYRDARSTLVGELGVEPGDELREMHKRVLAADPLLKAAAQATIGQAGGEHDGHVRPEAVVPRQLPGAVWHFTGRAAELDWLSGLPGQARTDDSGSVVVISGMAGVGKTALAVHWARQSAGLFVDGQLYVNLLGFAPSAQPADPATVIRGFLEALGVPAGSIPASPQAQAGLYRSLLADKRMLIVLDNARDAAQARPLLPGSPGCLVLVTSRSDLTGLSAIEGAHLLTLDVMAEAEAHELIARRLAAGRVAAEWHAVTELVKSCGGLPLALAIAAGRAAARPGHRLAALAAELREADRLDALQDGEAASSVRAVLSWSYRQLSPDGARLLRLLGLHPGPDIATPAAASLAGIPARQALGLLRELTRAHLLTEPVPGRYALHDLLRAYAAEQAEDAEDEEARRAAAGRVLGHYLHTAHAAALLLEPAREPIALAVPGTGTTVGELAGHQQALAWFEAEHDVLHAAISLAASTGFDSHAWQISWAMATFIDQRGYWHEQDAIQRTAVAAAARLGDKTGQVVARRILAVNCARLGDSGQARAYLTECLTLYRQLGDRAGEARAHHSLSWVADAENRYAEALSHDHQALALFQQLGDREGQAQARNAAGWHYAQLGDYPVARRLCRQALALYCELGNGHGESYTWDSLGYVAYQLGDHTEAIACYQRAVHLLSEFGNRPIEAASLTGLADAYDAVGDPRQARQARQQALEILDDLHHPDAEKIRVKLASRS
jgi:DNA-binding SARP family transcriptional activator/tetratricopeptide (TPR) repeat protein